VEEPKVKKWEYKFDQELILIKEKEEEKLIEKKKIRLEQLKKNEVDELKLKEDLVSKLESFDVDHNKKN